MIYQVTKFDVSDEKKQQIIFKLNTIRVGLNDLELINALRAFKVGKSKRQVTSYRFLFFHWLNIFL